MVVVVCVWCKWFTGSCKECEMQRDGAELGSVSLSQQMMRA